MHRFLSSRLRNAVFFTEKSNLRVSMSIKDGSHTVLVTHVDVLICSNFEGDECPRRPIKPDNVPNVAGIDASLPILSREIRAHPQARGQIHNPKSKLGANCCSSLIRNIRNLACLSYTERVSLQSYSEHVNPQWMRLLEVLQMNVRYAGCQGAELYPQSGGVILDFLSGYCVHNAGHNHPRIIAALKTNSTAADQQCCKATFQNLPVNSRGVSASFLAAGCKKRSSAVRVVKVSKAQSSLPPGACRL